MAYRIQHPIGVVVEGLPSGDLTARLATDLTRLLAHHGAVVVRDQPADDSAFLAFLRHFGELTFTVGETPVAGFPDLNVVTNVGRQVPPRSTFHVDSSYLRTPPSYTALRAVTVPERGGQTEFTNQYRAYETLPPDLRRRLEGRTITHVVTGLDLDDDAETTAKHPIFVRHPLSGRTALYLSTPKRCTAISDMTPAEGEETVQFLYEHSTREDNIYRHSWAPNDIVMWDNRCVMHRADHSAVFGDRVLHRGLIAGQPAKACAIPA